jgi:hypothetical protein
MGNAFFERGQISGEGIWATGKGYSIFPYENTIRLSFGIVPKIF